MATPRDIRRLALLALFQLDATAGDPETIRESLEDTESLFEEGLTFTVPADKLKPQDLDRAIEIATGAYESREAADAAMLELAPDWPAGRQAAIDRAILRLAHFEITGTDHPPKAVVNEAVELAKDFSTEKSPAFVNGLLGKFLKGHIAGSASTATAASDSADTAENPAPLESELPTAEPTEPKPTEPEPTNATD